MKMDSTPNSERRDRSAGDPTRRRRGRPSREQSVYEVPVRLPRRWMPRRRCTGALGAAATPPPCQIRLGEMRFSTGPDVLLWRQQGEARRQDQLRDTVHTSDARRDADLKMLAAVVVAATLYLPLLQKNICRGGSDDEVPTLKPFRDALSGLPPDRDALDGRIDASPSPPTVT